MTFFSRKAAGYLGATVGLVLAVSTPCLAQSQDRQDTLIRDNRQLVQSLRAGGYNIVVRHGATFSNQADIDPFSFDNIAKQRNLNDKGKELAKAFGDSIRGPVCPSGSLHEQVQSRLRDGRAGRIQGHRADSRSDRGRPGGDSG